ncbi:PEGA domain-containing protein [Chondromyces apiculatus]|uniref:PEGA domain-containing protein n=1 Tax=Chondromyces apiculatus DSM 436 TaxID=1192034 RepID=A0A017T215_9BACT|nr:PEGA domain-containing protein [Chondromyces apiculatus]EYF02895.1 Hypothetical protein CAP_6475 [Chondromyces apiculatus DSM 436]
MRPECRARRSKQEALGAVVLAAALLRGVATPALAAPQEPQNENRQAEATARYRKGRELYTQGEHAAALAEFLASRALHPTWSATSAAALSLKQLRRHDEALDMFEALLRQFGEGLSAERREAAQREIVQLRGLVGTVDIDGAEPGAAITVDGQDRGEFPTLAPLRVAVGAHLVRVLKEGFEPFEQRVDVAGGQTVRVQAKLRALARSGRLRVAETGGRALEVVVDGSVVGKTPWEGRLAVGEHVVSLRGEGDLGTPPLSVPVALDTTTPLTLAAEVLSAGLRVAPEPLSAVVAVDAVSVGRGIWEGRLREGAHRVEVAAPGFVPWVQEVSLGRGERKVLPVSLTRDPSSPFWPKPPRKPRFVVELAQALALVPSFGGDVAGGCTGGCGLGVGTGGTMVLRGGYELGLGLGFGLSLGTLSVTQTVTGRSALARPVGLSGVLGMVDDDLRLQGVVAGAWAGLTLETWLPIHVRLGAGTLLGTMRDARRGTLPEDGDRGAKGFGDLTEVHDARYFYLEPEVRLGLKLGEHVALNAGLGAFVLFAFTRPTWDETHAFDGGEHGYATFDAEALTGQIVVALAPGLGARYDF